MLIKFVRIFLFYYTNPINSYGNSKKNIGYITTGFIEKR